MRDSIARRISPLPGWIRRQYSEESPPCGGVCADDARCREEQRGAIWQGLGREVPAGAGTANAHRQPRGGAIERFELAGQRPESPLQADEQCLRRPLADYSRFWLCFHVAKSRAP